MNVTGVQTCALPIWCDHAEVFRDNRQVTESLANGSEQFPSRCFDPLTAFGSLVTAGNLPTRREATKVIDARDIDHRERRAHAFDTPLETVGEHAFPVVERIAPELSGAAEVI